MKIKARAQVPSGRQYEVLETSYEAENEFSATEVEERDKWVAEQRKSLKNMIQEDAKELFNALKGVKEIKEGDYIMLSGIVWRNLNGKWEYKEGETWKSANT